MQLQDHCRNGSSKAGGEAGVTLRELGTSARGCSPRPHCSQATQHLCLVLLVLRPGQQQQQQQPVLLLTPPTISTQSGIPASHLDEQRAEAKCQSSPVLGRRGQGVPLARRDSWSGSHQVLCSLLKQTEGGGLTLHVPWLCCGVRTNCL